MVMNEARAQARAKGARKTRMVGERSEPATTVVAGETSAPAAKRKKRKSAAQEAHARFLAARAQLSPQEWRQVESALHRSLGRTSEQREWRHWEGVANAKGTHVARHVALSADVIAVRGESPDDWRKVRVEYKRTFDALAFNGPESSIVAMKAAFDAATEYRDSLIEEGSAYTPCGCSVGELGKAREALAAARKAKDTEAAGAAQRRILELEHEHRAPLRAAMERSRLVDGVTVDLRDPRSVANFFDSPHARDLCPECKSSSVRLPKLGLRTHYLQFITALEKSLRAGERMRDVKPASPRAEYGGREVTGSVWLRHRDDVAKRIPGAYTPHRNQGAKSAYRTPHSDSFGAGQAWQRGPKSPRGF